MPMLHARCIAPPVTDEKITEWEGLASTGFPLRCWEAFRQLLTIVKNHRARNAVIIPNIATRNAYATEFDQLQEPQRTPAFHLLWYANELALGRNPEVNHGPSENVNRGATNAPSGQTSKDSSDARGVEGN